MFTNKIWYTHTQDQYVPNIKPLDIYTGDKQNLATRSDAFKDALLDIELARVLILNLQTRMTTAEANIVDLQTRMTTVESKVDLLERQMQCIFTQLGTFKGIDTCAAITK